MAGKRVLFIYYSLTEQTERVLRLIDDQLKAAGHTTTWKKIDPVQTYPLPVKRSYFLWTNARLWMGMDLNPDLRPMQLDESEWDHIVLGFQTWHLEPSFPVNAFLDSPMASIFKGKKVTLVQTCRNRWKRAQQIAIDKVIRAGGQVVCAYVLSNPDSHLLPTLYHLFNNADPEPGTPMARLTRKPFAFSDVDIETAREFGERLAGHLSEERFPTRSAWTVVHNQEG